jgi:hypothetical protein
MIQPRAADDFAKISARMKVLRRERERADAAESELPSDPPAPPPQNWILVGARGRTAPRTPHARRSRVEWVHQIGDFGIERRLPSPADGWFG